MEITDVYGKVELSNNVAIPYLGLGVYQITDGPKIIKAVVQALDIGYRHFDTAAVYGNERGLGKGIKNSPLRREEIFITSKVWNQDQGYRSTINAFEESLNKLGLDYLDLYLIHWPVPGKFLETWKALEEIYLQKKVRAIGTSNFLQPHLEKLLKHCNIPPMINQMEFHPYLIRRELVNFCQIKKIQYQAWSPLMKGKINELIELQPLAQKYGKSLAQIVLRWNLQRGVVTIPKSEKLNHLKENINIFDFYLTTSELEQIDSLDKNHLFGPDPNNFAF